MCSPALMCMRKQVSFALYTRDDQQVYTCALSVMLSRHQQLYLPGAEWQVNPRKACMQSNRDCQHLRGIHHTLKEAQDFRDITLWIMHEQHCLSYRGFNTAIRKHFTFTTDQSGVVAISFQSASSNSQYDQAILAGLEVPPYTSPVLLSE